MLKGTIVFYFYFKDCTRMYISAKRELNDNKATRWSTLQTFKMMLLRLFDNMGKQLYFSASKKKKDPKLYIHRNSAILGPFTLNETSSPTLVPSLMVLKVQSSGQQQQLLEIQTLRSHTDLWHQEPGVEPSNLCFNKPPRQF